MAYEGKHRRDDGERQGGRPAVKIAGLAGMAATAAAVVTVGMGAGTANADGGILHNLFSPKNPSGGSSSSNTVNANTTKPTSVFGSGFGQIVTVKPTPTPNQITNYFTPGQKGWAISGICLNPSGC